MTSVISNKTQYCVDQTRKYNTRHTGYSLNQSKQTTNLIKDATENNYDLVVNNHDENVNVKCSSGFYLEVANPALLFLAKQSSDISSTLIIDKVIIRCTNSRASLDNCSLLVNLTYFFDLCDSMNGDVLGSVTIHCHITTKLVQIQGSKLVGGSKAPV